MCCSPQGHKESDITQGLNNNNMHVIYIFLSISKFLLKLEFFLSVTDMLEILSSYQTNLDVKSVVHLFSSKRMNEQCSQGY